MTTQCPQGLDGIRFPRLEDSWIHPSQSLLEPFEPMSLERVSGLHLAMFEDAGTLEPGIRKQLPHVRVNVAYAALPCRAMALVRCVLRRTPSSLRYHWLPLL